jgi:hypothetical protein
MNEKMLYKILVVGVIVLFIGIGIQPAFADTSVKPDNSKLEKITIQICKENGIDNHIRYVTQQQIIELEALFDEFKLELDNALTIEETTKIYENMFESLDKMDLLIDDSNIEKTQDMILNKFSFLEKINRKNNAGTGDLRYENFLCLVSGWTSNTIFVGPIACVVSSIGALMGYILTVLIGFREHPYIDINFKNLIILFGALTLLLYLELPLIINLPADNREYHFGSLIGIGGNKHSGGGYPILQGKGWIHSVGLNGIQKCDDGLLRGDAIDVLGRIWDTTNGYEYFPAVRGFIGYGFKLGDKRQHYYIGSAWLMKVFNYPHLSPSL